MLDPTIVDMYIDGFTARELRDMLGCDWLNAIERACIITAIYYLEGTDNA